MKILNHLIAIVILILGSNNSYSQNIDTIYWVGDNSNGNNHIKSIVETFGDTTKHTNYWKGQIKSIKYQANINGCMSPILVDSVFSSKNHELAQTITHNIIHLSDCKKCDSLLRISTLQTFKNGTLGSVEQFKTLADFNVCPCGKTEFYSGHELVYSAESIACDNSKLDNLVLSSVHWKPDSTYFIEVYEEQKLFTNPGNGSEISLTLILKNHSGETIKVVSCASIDCIFKEHLNISWHPNKNMVSYAPARVLEWIDYEKVDLKKVREKINLFLDNDEWKFSRTPLSFGYRNFLIGDFLGDSVLDLVVLIEDSNEVVDLIIIENYNYESNKNVSYVDESLIFNWVGDFKTVKVGEPLWTNWTGDFRAFEEVPKNEIIYLTHDAIYLHAGDSCGGGFMYWKDNQWNWLQQE